MKIENLKKDVKFIGLKEKNRFINRCVFGDDMYLSENEQAARDLYESSKSLNQFVERYLSDDRFKLEQGYAELSKVSPNHWYRLRSILGNDCKKTYSDVGALKIGNDAFTINIPNGFGDGTTRYAILDRKFNTNMFNYFTKVNGTFNIYDYDCGDEILETITGEYYIYYADGFVVFEKGKDND